MKRVITLCILSCLAGVTQAHEGAEGVIKERMDRFKENKESMKAIKTNLGGDASIIAKEALAIKAWATQMTDFFPEGSTQSPSEALPAIWENFEDFKSRATANAKAAGDLADLARSGADTSALTNGLKALGKTCKDCHNDYKEQSGMITRRTFLKACATAPLVAVLPSAATAAAVTPFPLTASKTKKRLVPGDGYQDASVWAFNRSVPGPELRFKKGETLSVDFFNQLDEGSSVHWHGIRNINAMDGVAGLTQPEVMTDGQFRYEFPLKDSGTYWYHSHAKTWSQVARGLYGPLIVEDESDPAVDQDIVLMIDDWLLSDDGTIDEASFGSLHDWSHGGRLGNWLTVNGQSHPTIDVPKNARIRLRLINAANARIFGLNIPASAFLIAEDGYPTPIQPMQDVVLGPAQRADFIVDLGDTNLTINETLNGGPYPAVTLNVIETNQSLVTKEILKQPTLESPPTSIDVAIPLHMQGGAMGNLREATFGGQLRPIRELAQTYGKAWAFNGKIGEHHDHLAKINIGQSVSIEVWNDTRWNHAMHLHGHHFWIQTEDGEFLDGKRDTYLFQRGEKANLVFIADNPGLWLFHCHMLEHHAAGMAGVIEIS